MVWVREREKREESERESQVVAVSVDGVCEGSGSCVGLGRLTYFQSIKAR